METPQAAPAPAPTPAPEKRSTFDSVVISTPVLLTVIATFILGRSSSEMTKAQYQRAVASQKQSKVADEWAFFQAKRIRGTTYEATSIALFAQKAEAFTADTLVDAAEELLHEIKLSQEKAGEKGRDLVPLQKKAEAELTMIKGALNPPSDAGDKGANAEKIKEALDALIAYPKFESEKTPVEPDIDAEQRKLLDEILEDIRTFQPEKVIGEKTLKLKTDAVDKALVKAKSDAVAVNAQGKRIDRVLEKVDALVDRQVALAREYQRIVGRQIAHASKEKGGNSDTTGLEKRQDRVRDLSSRLLASYKAARFAFDARRYEDDARSNQKAAFLYDVHVFQSAAKSDKHLSRSWGFMIAMLVAQVGVTIGSLALALKRRIPVWLLAAIAGGSAIIFGVLVYLEMAPLL